MAGNLMTPEELARHMLHSEARALAAMVRALDWLAPNAVVSPLLRFWLRYDRWLYRQLLEKRLKLLPEGERDGIRGVGPEA
ncbi:MAG: hypothetical protein KF770_17540 [Anaerolineae bacterium]|nr:hypothetical protein [Anaerolineae bacterium]